MLSWILLILLLIIMIILLTGIFSKIFGRGEPIEPAVSTAETIRNNSRAIAAGRMGEIQFDLVPRGYRQDQVDAVIEDLMAQLAKARGSYVTTAPGTVDAEPKS